MSRRPGLLAISIALAVAAIATIGACGYEAPDYGDTHFRCDDAHPCPQGQVCVDNLCQAPGGDLDAPTGSDGTDAANVGITCDTETCTLDQSCCIDVVGGRRCQAPGAFCTGLSTRCDGPEDCPGGECCFTAAQGICTATGTCSGSTACHDTPDCTGAGESCCAIPATGYRGCFQNCP